MPSLGGFIVNGGGNLPEITAENSMLQSRLLLGKARRLLAKASQQELAPYNITPQQANVLLIIDELGDKVSFAKLAELTERRMNSMSVLIKRMENDGLLKRVKVKSKSNQLTFKLTEKGLNTCKYAKKIESIKTIMSALTEEERQQFISLLVKIINRAEEYQRK
jgi:DNA-binding MarR family transcriptional regulator